jgi:hypothetical protein
MSLNIRSAEGFALFSAVFGIALAALLAQTRVLAFGSFQTMALTLLGADALLYILMRLGVIKTPGGSTER